MYSDYGSSGFSPVVWLFTLALFILLIVAQWKIFEKAGKPGWYAIIPFVNQYQLFDIVYGQGWKFLLTFIPIVNIVYAYVVPFKLGKTFGKDTGFCLGMSLLGVIFYPILGFGEDEYEGPLC